MPHVDSDFIIYGFEPDVLQRPVVVTIGSFDGVHSGHRLLLERVKAMAVSLGAASVVVTFDPHPRIAMGRGEGMGLITTLEERAYLLRREGIDHMVVATFDDAFRQQHYADFVRRSLVSGLGMRGMIVGYNHRLGRGSEGSYDTLKPLAAECGFALECVGQHTLQGAKVSSTVVRRAIAEGNMAHVAELLDSPYIIIGSAMSGVIDVASKDKLLPPNGVYCVVVEVADSSEHVEAMATISSRRVTLSISISGVVVLHF